MLKRLTLLAFLGLLLMMGLPALAWSDVGVAVLQEDMADTRIYAYRGWQSASIRIDQGDILTIQAEGDWLYTPDEYNGPEGHPRYPAPAFYPLPNVSGGALIGRIGEQGQPFYVGQRTTTYASEWGTLYLRINDDLLGDNDGWVRVDIERTPAAE